MIRCDRLIVARSGRMVIDRLSLSVAPGEAVAVIGLSGAGKSSLLAAIAAVLPIQGGDILVAGRSVRRDPDAARAQVGYAPPHLEGWPAVRADEFLALSASAAGIGPPRRRAAVDTALGMAGLAGRRAATIDTLAAGQGKLLLVARAVLHGPDVLVLDDPFADLDPRQREDVERLVCDARFGGRAVVAAIDGGRVPDCFTRVAVLREGRIVHDGPAAFGAVAAGRTWRHRLRCPGQAAAAAAVVGGRAVAVDAVDAGTIDCVLEFPADPGRPPLGEIVAGLVRAGITVESAALHPHWTVQLLDQVG